MKLPDDPFIVELLPEFVDTWLNDIEEQFKNLIETKNAADLYRFGHTIKGSCFQFGLDEIANMGIELMGYSKSDEWDKAAGMESRIRDEFVNVKSYLDTLPPQEN